MQRVGIVSSIGWWKDARSGDDDIEIGSGGGSDWGRCLQCSAAVAVPVTVTVTVTGTLAVTGTDTRSGDCCDRQETECFVGLEPLVAVQ